eukprot:TRINITY_DN67831_c6_g9_i1.p1 TRINITY_DN67831_c6_g9~~TRINITY_DN67831_c6_g9_i1.p1  ORF type:complete len:349 (-),score=-8.81 TRINITY_DN67831_c6_g9_i1:987-2033(-)
MALAWVAAGPALAWAGWSIIKHSMTMQDYQQRKELEKFFNNPIPKEYHLEDSLYVKTGHQDKLRDAVESCPGGVILYYQPSWGGKKTEVAKFFENPPEGLASVGWREAIGYIWDKESVAKLDRGADAMFARSFQYRPEGVKRSWTLQRHRLPVSVKDLVTEPAKNGKKRVMFINGTSEDLLQVAFGEKDEFREHWADLANAAKQRESVVFVLLMNRYRDLIWWGDSGSENVKYLIPDHHKWGMFRYTQQHLEEMKNKRLDSLLQKNLSYAAVERARNYPEMAKVMTKFPVPGVIARLTTDRAVQVLNASDDRMRGGIFANIYGDGNPAVPLDWEQQQRVPRSKSTRER